MRVLADSVGVKEPDLQERTSREETQLIHGCTNAESRKIDEDGVKVSDNFFIRCPSRMRHRTIEVVVTETSTMPAVTAEPGCCR